MALLGAAAWWAWSPAARAPQPAFAERDDGRVRRERAGAIAPETASEALRPPVAAGADAPDERRAAAMGPDLGEDRLVVRGKVYDAASGEPWFGATIEARYPGGEPFLETSSDEQGLYRIEIDGGVPARLDLRASVEQRAAVLRQDLATRGVRGELVVDFALPGAFAVAGRVIDARTREPIPGAEIKVFSRAGAFAEDWVDGFSDAEGEFHLDELAGLPRHPLELVVRAEGYQPAHLAGLAVGNGADKLVVEVRLGPPLTLRGRVGELGTRRPIASARVESSARIDEFAEAGEETRTDGEGTFELPLGELPLEDALLYVQAQGFASARVDRPLGEKLEILLAPALTLRGRVVDAATGTPLGAADLLLEPGAMPDSVAVEYADVTVTTADGGFELSIENVPTGPARLRAIAPGFAARTLEVTLPGDAERGGGLVLELERSIVVRGVVSRRPEGTPVAGARVRALLGPDQALPGPSATTAGDGTYALELALSAAREARWLVEHRGRHHWIGPLELGDAPPAEVVRDLALEPPPTGD